MGRIPTGNVRLKRAYEKPAADDGVRILIDRLWPRGLRKADAGVDRWMKELAPSAALRRWFGHEPARWTEFCRRYAQEVRSHADAMQQLRTLARARPITLVYAARDEKHNDAVALRTFLLRPLPGLATRGAERRKSPAASGSAIQRGIRK